MSFGFTFAEDEMDSEMRHVVAGVDSFGLASHSAEGALGELGGEGGGSEGRPVVRDEEGAKGWSTRVRSRTWSLEALLPTLPPRISYSSLRVSLDDGQSVTLLRRDLFDARFQMLVDEEEEEEEEDDEGGTAKLSVDAPIAQSTDTEAEAEASEPSNQDERPNQRKSERQEVEVKDSDLVPGVYEGGLKTWECSLDLVRELEKRFGGGGGLAKGWEALRGRRILEPGCGTAIPSIFLLGKLLQLPVLSGGTDDEDGKEDGVTLLHLCDFNIEVLRLVTLPNLLLSFASSSHSSLSQPLPNAGELEVTPSFLESFTSALEQRRIKLSFSSGAWETLELSPSTPSPSPTPTQTTYDVILSSETIYNLGTLPSLLRLLRRTIPSSSRPVEGISTSNTTSDGADASTLPLPPPLPLTLIAAKILYFGVGGGVSHFVDAWSNLADSSQDERGGLRERTWCETTREIREGVGRVVLRIGIQ